MSYPSNVWNQLKDKSPGELIKALLNDGWTLDESRGAVQVYIKAQSKRAKRITIHLHPHKSYGKDTHYVVEGYRLEYRRHEAH